MPRSPVALEQRGGVAMWTSPSSNPVPGTYHYAVNMVPSRFGDGEALMMQRPPVGNIGTGTAAGSAVVAMGTLYNSAGTAITWLLSSSSGLWTVDDLGAYTNTVTAANLSTATITTAAAIHNWCVFNSTIVFSDGTNTPWTWDGTAGVGGLTKLTNAPVAYGRPTVYYAKLFFIKSSERDTIVWSEEAEANTGYEASGYSNVWKLGQTGTAPLYALTGTNEGLYYFRERSIGVIRGAVNADFVTSGVHDAVSRSVGTLSPRGVAVSTDGLWFADAGGGVRYLPFGGTPEPVLPEGLNSNGIGSEPYGFDLVTWSRGPSPTDNPTLEMLAVPPFLWMDRETVWLHVQAFTPTTGRAFLIFDAQSKRPLGWFVAYTGATASTTASVVYNPVVLRSAPAFADTPTGRLMFFGSSATGLSDTNASGTEQATTCRLIGSPLGASLNVEQQYERLSFEAGSWQNLDVSVQTLTSRRNPGAGTAVASAQTVAIAGTASQENVTKRYTIGLNQNGRWMRPVFTWSFTQASSTAIRIGGWSVLAYPTSTSPTVP